MMGTALLQCTVALCPLLLVVHMVWPLVCAVVLANKGINVR
uniref:Uncharacterized protein n=1 Tax=Arundo donax TaxID=35708 RepID=A0A0A9C5L0_ARUDO